MGTDDRRRRRRAVGTVVAFALAIVGAIPVVLPNARLPLVEHPLVGWSAAFGLLALLCIVYLAMDDKVKELEQHRGERAISASPGKQSKFSKIAYDTQKAAEWRAWYGDEIGLWIRSFHNGTIWPQKIYFQLKAFREEWLGVHFNNPDVDPSWNEVYKALVAVVHIMGTAGTQSQQKGYFVTANRYARDPAVGPGALEEAVAVLELKAKLFEHAVGKAGIRRI